MTCSVVIILEDYTNYSHLTPRVGEINEVHAKSFRLTYYVIEKRTKSVCVNDSSLSVCDYSDESLKIW